MRAVPGNNTIILISSLVLMTFSSQANAECSRDDITFYLEKGFSTDQITAMCSESSAKAQNDGQQSTASSLSEEALFLSRAIQAQKIKLNDDSLQYTLKTCIKYGDVDDYGFAPKVCPDVTYTIALQDFEVLSTGMKYGFYGTQEAHVKSSAIQREIIGNLQDQKEEDKVLILDAFEKGNETIIPVRDDFSLDEVKRVLLEISN